MAEQPARRPAAASCPQRGVRPPDGGRPPWRTFAGASQRHDLLELPIHDTEVRREAARALPFHRAAEDRRSAALRADAVALVDGAVLKPHLADGCAGQPDLIEVVAARKPGRVSIDLGRR